MATIELSSNEQVVLTNALTHYYDHMDEDDEDNEVVERLIELVGTADTVTVKAP